MLLSLVGRIAATAAYCYIHIVAWSIGLLVTFMNPAKTTELIEMPFGG